MNPNNSKLQVKLQMEVTNVADDIYNYDITVKSPVIIDDRFGDLVTNNLVQFEFERRDLLGSWDCIWCAYIDNPTSPWFVIYTTIITEGEEVSRDTHIFRWQRLYGKNHDVINEVIQGIQSPTIYRYQVKQFIRSNFLVPGTRKIDPHSKFEDFVRNHSLVRAD